MIKNNKSLNKSRQISEMDWNNIQRKLANDRRPYARKMAKKVDDYINSDEYYKMYSGGNTTPRNRNELIELINAEVEQMENGHLDLTHFDLSRLNTLESVFNCVKNKSKIKSLDVSGWDVSGISDKNGLVMIFYSLYECEEINVSGWKLNSQINTLYGLFKGCTKLENIIGLEDWDVSNITLFVNVFDGCKSLKVAPISKWAPKLLKSTSEMFNECESLVEPNISNFDFSHVTTVYSMFYNCRSLRTLDCRTMDMRNVERFNYMFYGCDKLQDLPGIEDWNVSKGNEFEKMFKNCKKLRCDISSWNIAPDAGREGMLTAARNIECDWEDAEYLLENRRNRSFGHKKITESVSSEVISTLDDYVVLLMMMLKGNVKKTPFNADVRGLQKDLVDSMGIKNTVHSNVLGMDIVYDAYFENGNVIIEFNYDRAEYQFVLDGKMAVCTEIF